jgi:hypothetical protein
MCSIRRDAQKVPRAAKKLVPRGVRLRMTAVLGSPLTQKRGNAMSSEGSVTRWVRALQAGDARGHPGGIIHDSRRDYARCSAWD